MIRSSKFDVTDQDITVARNNLEIIAGDKNGVNRDNSGWCYLIAPLFSFLTEPRFIRLLRKYKARYYYNGQLKPNWDFLKAMYGESYQTDEQLKKVIDILDTLCRHTNANGQLLPVYSEQQYSYQYNTKVLMDGITERQWITKSISSQYVYLVKLVHHIRNQGAIDDMKIMYNYLSDCTAIMSESPNVLSYSTTKKIINGQTVDLTKMKEDLERGLCIVACANGAHIFNIYQYKDENGNKCYRLLNSTPYASYSFKRITDALVAYTPETNQQECQKYWLCARTEEAKVVDKNKRIGIEKYLKTHNSYLDQPSNPLGFNNQNNKCHIMINNNKIPNGKCFKPQINSQKNNINMNMCFNPTMNNCISPNNFGNKPLNHINQNQLHNFIPNMMFNNGMNQVNSNKFFNNQIHNPLGFNNKNNQFNINNPFINQKNMPEKKVSNQHQYLRNLIIEYDNLCKKILSTDPNNQQAIQKNILLKKNNIWCNIQQYVNQHKNNKEVFTLYQAFLNRHPGRKPHH